MKKTLAIAIALFHSALFFAQPANDNCATAQAIGSLPTPAGCPSGAGANVTVPGTLNGATSANPYTYQGVGCTGTNTSMASPAIDVWYTFVATGYQLNLTMSGTVANPNIALYSGNCASLGGGIGGCAVGTAGGAATLTVQQMVPGTTYYLQVSGNTPTATGNFTMTINNSVACNDCLGATNLTVNPAPTNGAYAPGTTVNFCYKVNGYTQVNTNWLHGVQVSFGSCWNLASLTTTPPPPCQGTGYWAYYAAGITDNTGQAWPAGFYFETVTGQNNPGNNFGDNCSGTISAANWNFCFSIKTSAACNPGCDLGVTINTSGDGESGSWSNLGCQADPSTVFHAIGACCPPTMAATAVSCNGGSDGTATATPVGTQSPFTYTWTPTGGNTSNATGLPAGTYTVKVTDNNNCLATNTVTVTQPTPVTLTLTPTDPTCGNSNGSISSAAGGGTPAYQYQINGGGFSGTSNFTGLATGSYTVDVKDSKGCIKTASVTLNTTGSSTITANPATICNGGSTVLTANGAASYTWSANAGGVNTSTVSVSPGTTTIYTVTGDNGGCVGTNTVSVTVNPLPVVTVSSATICNGGSATLTANGATTYSWTPGTGLSATTGSSVTANPASTQNYTVTGTDAGGCVNTATTSVTVVPNPSVTVTSGTICAGQQTATLTATGAGTYAWSPGTGLSATTGSVVVANPGATQTYTITGTVGTCTAVGTSTVTVNPLPVVTVNNAAICNGQQTATLTANGATNYTWTPATGLSSTSGSPVTANPSSTSTYTVTGTDANGCVSSATSNVVVNPIPVITVNNGFVCNGNSITLTANGAVTYSWMPGTGLSATTGSSVNANPTSTTQYTVVGVDVNGCVNGDTSTVTVVNNPTVTATTGTICAGQGTATLTASGASTYTWSPSATLSSSTGTSVTATPPATQVYTVTGTVGTCTASGTTTVTVNPLPTITATSNSPVCVNGVLTFTAGGGVNYNWSGPNNFNPAGANPSINGVTALAAGIYTVIGMDALGCVNTQTTNVIINPLPVVSATGATVCIGQTINLSSTPAGAAAYSWSDPVTGYTSNNPNPSIPNAALTDAGSYIVTITDGNGCVSAAVANVVVNSLPVITVNNGTICGGQTSATITAGGANTYMWSPGTGLSSTTGASVVANPTTTSTYSVTGTDLNGCQSTSTFSIMVNPAPIVVVSPNNASGCVPLCVTFSNTGGSSGSCSWNYGQGAIDQNCAGSHCYTTAGSYNVSLQIIDGNGCLGTGTSMVTAYPLPDANFNASPQPTTILEPSIQFYDASNGAIIGSWQWNFGDFSTSNTSVLQNPGHVYGDTGSYVVTLLVVSNHGCRDSTFKVIRIEDDYALYVPNAFSPNSDGVNDEFRAIGSGVKSFKMYIFDRWGNQVFFSDDIYRGWDGRFMSKGSEEVLEDVYVWKIEARTIRNDKRLLSGTVTLIK